MIHPQAQWTAPAPLWPDLADTAITPDPTEFRQPTILRFATDDFMDEFLKVLGNAPQRMGEWKAVWETWRQPAPIPQLVESPLAMTHQVHNLSLGLTPPDNGSTPKLDQAGIVPDPPPLKLYQPAHQRFYLISACLVCRIPGMPDRMLDINRGEKATFVIRRLLPSDTLGEFDEYAFVLTPQGARWQRLGLVTEDKTRTLLPGEDQLPLFGVTYPESDGRKRRLLAGLIPVGKRETYIGSAVAVENGAVEDDAAEDDADAQKPMDPREAMFISQVVQPWRSLAEQKSNVNKRYPIIQQDNPELWADIVSRLEDAEVDISQVITDHERIRQQTTNQIQIASWYILLDFAKFLQTHLNSVWKVLPLVSDDDLTLEERALLTTLGAASSTNGLNLAQALVDIESFRDQLEGANLAFDDNITGAAAVEDIIKGPNLFFPRELGDPEYPGKFARSLSLPTFLLTDIAAAPVIDIKDDAPVELVTTMEDAVADALKNATDPAMTAPPLPLAAQQQNTDVGDPGWFIIRCVYERTHCIYNPPVVVSKASVPFQLASFFDPDGPARPIRISLPLDTSPAGLRKFAKNTAFVMSDILTCQIGQVRNLTLADLVLSVLPWPFHKDLPSPKKGDCKDTGAGEGMVCSLSIPIVTICALILLIIIVTLFEQFFHWIQFLIVCFKIPGLKGKGND